MTGQGTIGTRIVVTGANGSAGKNLLAMPPGTRGKLRLPVFMRRGGLLAGIDPLSNKSLLDALGDDA